MNPTDTPTTPAAAPTTALPPRKRVSSWVYAALVLFGGLAYQSYIVSGFQTERQNLLKAIAVQKQTIAEQQKTIAEVQAAVAVEHKRVRELESILDEIRPLVPPTNDKLFTILSKGIGVTEEALQTSNVGTTPGALFATDLTTSQQTDAYTQEIMVQNEHATQNLCVAPIAWSSGGGATCALKCAAATITCSGAATDGWRIGSSQTLQKRYDGTACLCGVGSGAGTNFQSLRVLRRRPPLRRRARRIFRVG